MVSVTDRYLPPRARFSAQYFSASHLGQGSDFRWDLLCLKHIT